MLSDMSERSDSQSTITGSAPAGKGHQRSKSTIMYDKLLDHEIKDLLICLMYVVKNVNEGRFSFLFALILDLKAKYSFGFWIHLIV